MLFNVFEPLFTLRMNFMLMLQVVHTTTIALSPEVARQA